jgi:DNA helicase-4
MPSDRHLNSWWLPRLLRQSGPELRVGEKGLTWTATSTAAQGAADFSNVTTVKLERGLLWSTIVVDTASDSKNESRSSSKGKRHEFTGYRYSAAEGFVDEANNHLAKLLLKALAPMVQTALLEWDRPKGKDQFLSVHLFRTWRDAYSNAADRVASLATLSPASIAGADEVKRFKALIDGGEKERDKRNTQWVAQQKITHHAQFGGALGYPLNEQQVTSILMDEHRTLVVAGAGTGKTSTVVAKAKWILAQKLSTETNVKLLAFNRDAAKEINSRFGKTESDDALASTFHSLGMRLVGEGRGKKPRLTKLNNDDQGLQKFLRGCIEDALNSKTKAGIVISFLAYFRFPEPVPVPIEKSHEANRWADGHDIRSFTGVRLRSNSEAIVANWLTLHGIKWEYEKDYQADTATPRYSQYRPDFYLPAIRAYIEHWACTESGGFPGHWDAQEVERYRSGMRWKRELHAKNRTTLIETFSALDGGISIPAALERQLKELGHEARMISPAERNSLISTAEIVTPVVTLLNSFLSIFKESRSSLSQLRADQVRAKDPRAIAFLDLFSIVHAAYDAHLKEEGAIDFADMIREAAELVRSEAAAIQLDYLLVDEFQDISRGRAELVKAILEQNPDCRLVAVGDDWQSIYRFAGSDIGVMVDDFQKIFGEPLRTDLTQTHRFGSSSLQATSKFIQENPQQLRKSLTAARVDIGPTIQIISSQSASKSVTERAAVASTTTKLNGEEDEIEVATGGIALGEVRTTQSEEEAGAKALEDVLMRISEEAPEATVLVLGRYRFLEKRLKDQRKIPRGLKATFSTVHKAKGLEADYVVIVDVVTGRYGFPSEIEDDPIMNLVLASEQLIPNAEERRLLYVAGTRARRKTFILTDDHRRSQFIDELEGEEYREWILPSNAGGRVADCPECGGSTLKLRVGKFGAFYGCSSMRCKGKAFKCPACHDNGLVKRDQNYHCLFCEKPVRSCPKCSNGFVRHVPAGISARTGKPYPAFNACSTNTLEPKFSCWTENASAHHK